MWLILFLIPLLFADFDVKNVLIGLPICLFAGMVWGGTMRFWMNRRGRVKQDAVADADKPRH